MPFKKIHDLDVGLKLHRRKETLPYPSFLCIGCSIIKENQTEKRETRLSENKTEKKHFWIDMQENIK